MRIELTYIYITMICSFNCCILSLFPSIHFSYGDMSDDREGVASGKTPESRLSESSKQLSSDDESLCKCYYTQ